MSKVAVLAVQEAVQIDQARVTEIVTELGEGAGQTLIIAAMEQLALALRQTLRAAAQDDGAQVLLHVEHLSRLAWQVGLVTLAGVAVDVGRCVDSHNRQAMAATLSRLERVANSSLMGIWDDDLPIEP
ncbi:hypothetical protein [Paracoccus sp. (in: a-proteobacteria)]|uniref:hypothetical protein n=1 Tax=Paracoccus sp. TaxID=267 RepID=UPI00289FF742|nr:hypothetical protein [Paracoccus sp. (in: a-proteobacteria)]